MVMDACVLIDFIKADRDVLRLVSRHVGPLHVISSVMLEVKDIGSENDLVALGVIVIEPEIEDAYVAASLSGSISFEDWLCLMTAKRHGFTCVTNDRSLRKVCIQQGVSLIWGLELVAELFEADGIRIEEAEAFARRIRQANPRHITEEILSRFLDRIQLRVSSGLFP